MRKALSIAVFFVILLIILVSCSSSPSSSISDIGTPSFSTPAGLYDEEFTLEIYGSEDFTIRYTLDGSEPDDNSPIYEQPILIVDRSPEDNDLSMITGMSTTWDYTPSLRVSKGTVVRAALFSDDGLKGDTVTATYFVGLDYEDALVVSIVTDIDGLFSYENGIFMLGKHFDEWKAEVGSSFVNYGDWEYQGNFSQKGDEWEREINIEFFEDGELVHSQVAGMRVAGAATRTYRQKSLRITARSQYGEKRFDFELIPDNMTDGFSDRKVTSYRSFVLRNGGNDSDYSRVRDPFIQNAVADCSFSTQQTRPAVAFINGEYWGVYTVTEDYNERYIEENYGIDKDNVAIIKKGSLEEGSEEDINLFYDVKNFITSNDMSDSSNYAAVCDMLDTVGFAQYCALNIYIGSQDGPFEDNNWRMWRAVDTSDAPYGDGKLRIMLYDTEFSMGLYNNGNTYYENTFDNLYGNSTFCGSIFNALMNNEQFRSLFIEEFLKMRNVRFSPDNADKLLNELFDDYSGLMTDHYTRFGSISMTALNYESQFRGKINHIKKYVDGRYAIAPTLLCEYLGLDPDTSIITAADGSVSIIY